MKTIVFLATGFLSLILFASCKNDNTVMPPPRTDIHLDSNAQVGSHLVDKDGRTLYFFSNDVKWWPVKLHRGLFNYFSNI